MAKHRRVVDGATLRGQRSVLLLGVVATTAGLIAGNAFGAPTTTTSTTDVSFVALNPAHKLLSAVTIAANKTNSPVVAGGATTVPTNATAVRLTVTAKGAAGGVLNFYPAQNLSSGSGQFLSYPSGDVSVGTTIEENIGQADQLTFANSSGGSVVVTATLTGYSTQITAGTINGTGGTSGQVLTNDGTGGASWQTPQPSTAVVYFKRLQTGASSVVLSLPAGSYDVFANAIYATSLQTGGPFDVTCFLSDSLTPGVFDGAESDMPDATPSLGSSTTLPAQVDVTLPSAATVKYNCFTNASSAEVSEIQIRALTIDSIVNQ